MTRRHWEGLSLLDALRPDPGRRVSHAVLATYSVDLVALVAALLALSGCDDDRGSGSKVDLAQAVEQLRGRVRILAQAGRVQTPKKSLKIMVLLDQFLTEVQADEQTGSWHPKAALVRYEQLQQDPPLHPQWHFWVSSRNLTRDMSWDAGMLLVGQSGGGGRKIPGLTAAANDLLDRAELSGEDTAALRGELEQLNWQGPPRVQVEQLDLLTPGMPGRGLPAAPKGVREMIVISPFLDATTVQALGNWGDTSTRRLLMSTRESLTKLSAQNPQALPGFAGHCLAMESPEESIVTLFDEGEQPSAPGVDPGEQELEGQGLHAKLIYARHAAGQTLWLGSANATQRGWKGPNYEVVARLTLSDPAIAEGLETLIELGRSFDVTQKVEAPFEPDEIKLLEQARNQVAARWQVTQQHSPKECLLVAEQPPHPDHGDVKLEVGLLGYPLREWPRGVNPLALNAVPLADMSELLQIQLSLQGSQLSWLQKAQLNPLPGLERDRQALARHLDARTFLMWIRSLLSQGDLLDGGGDWWRDRTPQGATAKGSAVGALNWAPTLEDVLRAWSRNPDTLADVDRKVRHYLDIMKTIEDQDRTDEESKALEEFWRAWQVLSSELPPLKAQAP